jgi:macrolide phosphotransferase
MAKSPLILAALAKDAVPQLNFNQAVALTSESADLFDSALLTASDGHHYVVRQARGAGAELQLDTEVAVLRAITPFKTHFPFETTSLVGAGRDARGRRVHLFSYVYGTPVDLSRAGANSPLVNSLANTLAAIHSLPTSLVENSGLPSYDSADVLRNNVAAMDRLAQTGRVPAALLNRWERAFEDVNLWKFQPAVVHNGFSLDNVLAIDENVSGVLGWHSLGVGDPAVDFASAVAQGSEEFVYSLMLEYENLRGSDANLRTRARLYSEMDLAEYLAAELAARDEAGIENAEALLADLVQNIEDGLVPSLTPRPLGEDTFVADTFSSESSLGGVPLVEIGQAVVSDDRFFESVPDTSFDHRKLFGDTGVIDVPAASAAEPAAAVQVPANAFEAPRFLDDVDDATAPITLPAAASETAVSNTAGTDEKTERDLF